jgi:hypothetical protein
MSSNTIVNGAPMVILRGTQDLSTRTLPVEAEVLPTHLPKVYIYAQKGPTAPQLVVGNSRNQMYGDDTFDLRKPFATHQTVLSNTVNAKGNSQMIERIVPDDVGPKSNFLLSLDVLASTTVQQYTRDANGAFILNPTTGLPVAVTGSGATLTGYKVKWVISNISTLVNELMQSVTKLRALFNHNVIQSCSSKLRRMVRFLTTRVFASLRLLS